MAKILDVVIISFAKDAECEKVTLNCLKSLLDSEENFENLFNIIVVESNPNVKWDYLSKCIKTYDAPLPYGYNKFLNYGRKKGNSEWVALCNNDLKFTKNWFSNILKASLIDSNILSFSPICPLTQAQYGILPNSGNYLGYEVRKTISGWCIVHKRCIYDIIGDLDENFTHWCCDNDYAACLYLNKLKHGLVTSSIVFHHDKNFGIVTESVVKNQDFFDELTKSCIQKFNQKYSFYLKEKKDMKRFDIINHLIEKNNYSKYLEIGVNSGECFEKIKCLNKIGIDVDKSCRAATYHVSSDDFFNNLNKDEKFDVIFIDGLHIDVQVDKDIENSLNHLSEGGIIVLHDTNPPLKLHAGETICYDPPINGNWTGTVYKSIIKLRTNRDDLEINTVDTDWGVTFLKKVNSKKLNIVSLNNEITWEFFDINRKEILNLITPEEFCKVYAFEKKLNKIGLCMIVKNEEHIIIRCLESVKRLIDYVLIVDTGSTDNTVGVINNWLKNNKIEGNVLHQEWKDFSFNRTHALSEIRKIKEIDYVLMIDADEILKYENDVDINKIKSSLNKDLHSINCHFGKIKYLKNTITKNSKPFSYKGVLHEFLYNNESIEVGETIKGVVNVPIQDSNRNKNIDKYKKDAVVLEEAIKIEKDSNLLARYCFYLAQSYRDSNEKEKAIFWYNERVKHKGWDQEVYYSLYQIAKLKEMLNYNEDEVIQSYMKAHESCPSRIEAIFGAIMSCRKSLKFNQAYILAKHAKTLSFIEEGLFVENWIYEFGLDDELSVCCYFLNKFKEGFELTQKILDKVPLDQKSRIINNLEQYKKKI